jgi:CRISPR-associated endonuclease/helicase Cas3
VPEVEEALTEDDDSSFRHGEVTLQSHSRDVRDLAEAFARMLGFDDRIVADLRLAAWLHDVGKADPRFQRWLVGGSEVRAAMLGELLAKSSLPPGSRAERQLAQARAGYPHGYRHELLSLAMVERNTDILAQASDRDLVLHLVASHHGWCRPFAPLLDHPDDFEVTLEHDGVRLSGRTRHFKARLDGGVGGRFWLLTERYGWWGLAWLEAVMRLADHRASEAAAEQRA